MGEKSLLFRKGEKAAKVSAFSLLALSALKGIVALISGSIALLADSIHSFADIFSSVAVWAGLKLVQKKPAERFPYGYYEAETFSLLVVSLVIIASGVLILKESMDKLLEPTVISFPALALAVAALSGLVSYVLARYKGKMGRVIIAIKWPREKIIQIAATVESCFNHPIANAIVKYAAEQGILILSASLLALQARFLNGFSGQEYFLAYL